MVKTEEILCFEENPDEIPEKKIITGTRKNMNLAVC